MIILKHYDPYIKTTPDECIPFVLLERGSDAYNKFVMENFISFRLYDYQDEVPGYYYLRFENYLYWDAFEGFDSLFIPEDVLGKSNEWLFLMISVIQEGYLILVYVNERYITFYQFSEDNSHRMIVYGVDEKEKFFLCQDFSEGLYRTFKVTFGEMAASMGNYHWKTVERNGLFALRVNDRKKKISYRKLYNGLCSMQAEAKNRDIFEDGIYGLSALQYNLDRFVIKDMKEGSIITSYVWLNVIRESCKLMQDRIYIMNELDGYTVTDKTKDTFEFLKKDVDNLFYKAMKWSMGGQFTCEDKEAMKSRLYGMLEVYSGFVENFKEDVYRIL